MYLNTILLFFTINLYLYYRVRNGINSVPGSIQFSFWYIINYFGVLLDNTRPKKMLFDKVNGYKRLYGYSCRQLFELYIRAKKNENCNLTIAVTPIHHTSFRNIIEKYFKEDEIYILELDEKYQKIIVTNEIMNNKIDIVLISHLWGNNLDMSELAYLKDKSLFIEDSVLGSEYMGKISSQSDLYFHSCGMDKRPASLFGGYVDIKKVREDDINMLFSEMNKLPLASFTEKRDKLCDVIILHTLYNSSFLQQLVKMFCYIINYKLSDITQMIRKNKPGFQHDSYMKCPNSFMVDKMVNLDNVTYLEQMFKMKNANFKSHFNNNQLESYFPWKYTTKQSTLPYNPILIKKEFHDKFLYFFNKRYIPVIKNPTYVTFNKSSNRYKEFLENIFYLPNMYNMDYNEQSILINYVSKYIKNEI